MSLTIEFELDDEDLKHFRGLMKKAKSTAKEMDEEEILEGTAQLLEELNDRKVPAFVRDRVSVVEDMKAMLEDEAFGLPAPERKRVLTALAYFLDPDDLIADEIPVLGFLDDAIMIELVSRELQHELQAYRDFNSFRESEAKRRGLDAPPMTREKWMESKRRQLIQRIRTRRSGGSRSSSRRRSPFSLY